VLKECLALPVVLVHQQDAVSVAHGADPLGNKGGVFVHQVIEGFLNLSSGLGING